MHDGGDRGSSRAFRGLVLVFLLTFVNLVGLILTTTALGGLAPWSRWQFVGAFGALEAAAGLANVLSPNVWHLPVEELETSRQTRVKLAASTLLMPHWGGLARCAAGLVCLALAAWHEGLAPASLGLVLLLVTLAWWILAVSALSARAGVARPDLDVVQLVVRWGGQERELRPISLGAAVVQFVVTILTIPAVKLLPPSVLYRPALGPSATALLVSLVGAVLLGVLVALAWRGRIDWRAPREQQREAEAHA